MHSPDQLMVALGQVHSGIQVFWKRPTHAEHTFLFVRLVNVGQDANTLFKLIKRHDTLFEFIDILGKTLDLLALENHLFGLMHQKSFQSALFSGNRSHRDVIEQPIDRRRSAEDQEERQSGELCAGKMDLSDL